MNARKYILPLATAGICSILVVGAVAGQDPEDEAEALPTSRTGTIDAVPIGDGETEYQLTGAEGTIRLSVGPPWFWGAAHPLDGISGDVTVTGQLDDGTPPARANAANRADGEPSFEVFTLNGIEIRKPGKPPWAGGPAAVGDRHPGHAGWSRGPANPGGGDD